MKCKYFIPDRRAVPAVRHTLHRTRTTDAEGRPSPDSPGVTASPRPLTAIMPRCATSTAAGYGRSGLSENHSIFPATRRRPWENRLARWIQFSQRRAVRSWDLAHAAISPGCATAADSAADRAGTDRAAADRTATATADRAATAATGGAAAAATACAG